MTVLGEEEANASRSIEEDISTGATAAEPKVLSLVGNGVEEVTMLEPAAIVFGLIALLNALT